jgi:hypothetical protein
MATLPLQGVAAHIKAFCVSLHGETTGMTMMMMMTAADQMPDASMMPSHDQHAMHHVDVSDGGKHASHAAAQHKHAACGACASCCMSTFAAPLALFSLVPQPSSQAVAIYPPALPASFIATGPDRPPKFAFA